MMKMWGELVLLCVLFISAASGGSIAPSPATSTGAEFWDCNREGQVCTGTGYTGCNAATGDCTCKAAGLPAYSLVNKANCVDTTTTCSSSCNSQGVCYSVGGTPTCFCNPDYTGTDCATKRLDVSCTSTGFTVNIRPFTGFVGSIYAVGKSGTPACTLTGSNPHTITLTYADPNACGVSAATAYDDTGSGGTKGFQYTTNFHIQYSSMGALFPNDQLVTVKCQLPDTGTVISLITSVDASNLNPTTGSGFFASPVAFKFKNAQLAEIASGSTVLFSSTPITIELSLLTTNLYTDFRVETCTASNRALSTDPLYDSMPFVASGCPQNVPIVAGSHGKTTILSIVTVTIPIKPFVFIKGATGGVSNQLHISCTLTLCASPCTPPVCTTGFNPTYTIGAGRRRRATAEGTTDGFGTRTVEGILIVRAANYNITETISAGTSGANTSVCLKNPEVQTALAIMGLAIFGLLVGLAIAVFAACRRRRDRKKPDTYPAYSNSGFDMHIPRPKA